MKLKTQKQYKNPLKQSRSFENNNKMGKNSSMTEEKEKRNGTFSVSG